MSASTATYDSLQRDAQALTSLLVMSIAGVLLYAITQVTGSRQVLLFAVMAMLIGCRRLPQLSHPLVWFTPLFMLYSISFPTLALIGVYVYDADVQRTVALHATALFMFSLVPLWYLKPYPPQRPLALSERGIAPVARVLLQAGLPVALLSLMAAATLGLSSKRELVDSGSPVLALTISMLNALFLTGILLITREKLSRSATWVVWALGGLAVLAIGMLGERDYLLRLAICLLLLAWDLKRKPTLRTSFLIGLALFLLLPMLQAMKAVFIGGGNVNYTFAAADLIGQEFRVMAQNTYRTLTSDASRLLSPAEAATMEAARVIGAGRSLAAWFNEVIVGTGEQRGFSMVAAAYLIGGSGGVAIAYLLAGVLFNWLYDMRRRSLYWLTAYVLLVPAFVYAQRADFSNFIAPALKWVGLPLLLLVACVELTVASAALRARGAANAGLGVGTN